MELGQPRHPGRTAVRQQRQGPAEAHRRPPGRGAARHHLPVRIVVAPTGGGARPRRPHRLGEGAGRELGGLHRRRTHRGDVRRQGARHPRADRRSRDRLQQDPVRRRRARLPERSVDLGRPPGCGEGVDEPGGQAIRVLVPDGRLGGLRLALRPAALAAGRLDPQRGRVAGGVQLARGRFRRWRS